MIKTYKKYKELIINKSKKKLSFDKIDDRYYYIYRITNILLGKHYYGSRVTKINPADDLGYKYFSSSTDKEFINDQKENPQNYKYKVVIIFNNNGDKICYESYLHQYFNVLSNDTFYNKNNQTPFGRDTTGISPENTYSYKIYNNEDILMYSVIGNISTFCKQHNLPAYYIIDSYKNKGKSIYVTKFDYRYNKIKDFIGWYCLINDETKTTTTLNIEIIDKIGRFKKALTNKRKSECKKGAKHNNFKVRYIHIPKLDKILKFDDNSGFNKFSDYLKYNDLPAGLNGSALNGGKPIYCDVGSDTIANKKGYSDYIGAYVLYENEIQKEEYINIDEYIKNNIEKHLIISKLGGLSMKEKHLKVGVS